MKKISYYPDGIMLKKGRFNYPSKYLSFNELLNIMKSESLNKQIKNLRKKEYKSLEYKNAKKRLPVVLFNQFEYNLNEGILNENEIKPFDVDFSDNTKKEIETFRTEIKKRAFFIMDSPSGKGLKFFIKKMFNTIDPKEYFNKYKNICKDIENEFNIVLDYAQGRIKQPFFLTYIKQES